MTVWYGQLGLVCGFVPVGGVLSVAAGPQALPLQRTLGVAVGMVCCFRRAGGLASLAPLRFHVPMWQGRYFQGSICN